MKFGRVICALKNCFKLRFKRGIMAARIFKIRKQTFERNLTLNAEEWTVNIAAHDQHGDEYHKWKMTCTYKCETNGITFIDLSVSATDINMRYERSFCVVKLSARARANEPQYTGPLNAPKFNGIHLPHIYCFGYEGVAISVRRPIKIYVFIASYNENKFLEDQKILLDEGTLTDTIIKTKDLEFPCHKFVLASHSEYFKKMFQTDMKESQTNCVDWSGVFDAPVVKDLLHYFYTGQEPPNIKENHFGLLEAAHLCLLPNLKGMCIESIVPAISVENAAYVLQSAVLYESNCLKSAAVKFVASNENAVLATDSYQQMEPHICKSLLKSIFKMFSKNLVDEK